MEKTIQKLTRIKVSRKGLDELPEEAGVYFFFAQGTPIYIGKAINLKARLSSYFTTRLAPKTAKMISEAQELTFIKVESELDALLLEAKLIHDLQPHYNAALKDDKHPLYIRITKEKYPRVITARKIEESDPNLAFYGPFPSSWSVRSVLKMLRRIFPYSEHKVGSRPCLYSHIGLCEPCPNFIESLESRDQRLELRRKYLRNVRNIKRVLERRTDRVLKELYSDMSEFSKEERFEEAKIIRDQINALEYISQPILPTEGFLENPNLLEDLRTEELKDLRKILMENGQWPMANLRRIECFDVAHLSGTFPTASMVTFIDGKADKNFYRHFRIRQEKGMDDVSSMREVISRRIRNFGNWGRPDLIIVDGGKGQVGVFQKALAEEKIPVVGLAKQFETLVTPQKEGFKEIRLKESPALHLLQRIRDEAHRFARRYHHKLLVKKFKS